MSKITEKGIRIRELLLSGMSQKKIQKLVGGSKSNISKHSQRLNNPKPLLLDRYDWKQIQECANAGETVRELGKRFNFTPTTWAKAVKAGCVVNPIRIAKRGGGVRNRPLEWCFVVHEKRFGDQNFKKRMIRAGLLKDECAICGCPPVWRGLPLVLRLDHINGDNRDCRDGNIRLVCPNCDSQLPTFTGRNRANRKRILAGMAEQRDAADLKSAGVTPVGVGFSLPAPEFCAVSEGRAAGLQNRRTGLKSLTALQN